MNSTRFQDIEALYHAAREATSDERAALLAQTDPQLRREVESLLSERGPEFLDRPAIEYARDLLEDVATAHLETGARLGPYRIEYKLGEGGMGEVFRAVDTRLDRAVAIKVTLETFGVRFAREARAIAALNHPHICTLYDVGPDYLVMELVEGETLAALLKRGPLELSTALSYASQIAAALTEAHVRGIVHRDLKPGNLMVAASGIKVLDFGLAKSERDRPVTTSSTATGTPGYMAPEQREGKPTDARMDIYAFGCVLYEMLTGERVTLPRRRLSSRKLEHIVSRCLAEDPRKRWQSSTELQRALADVPSARRATSLVITASAILALTAAVAYFYSQRAPKLTSTDTIVLAEFVNTTGDPVFDDTLRHGLAVQLQQSPFLSLISDERVRRTLPLMNQPPDARFTHDIAHGVCVRIGSAAVLEGSIALLGSDYVLGLRARHCATGDILADEQAQAARKEDVLGTLGQMVTRFRTRVGESLATVEKHSTPLEEATTPSLEALKAFSAGRDLAVFNWERRLPFFQRAIAIDPEFAMAHALLGFGYNAMGESVLGRQSLLKAYELRHRASDVERLNIEALYDRDVTGNLDRERRTLQTWAESYPRDPRPHSLMSGLALTSIGQYELAITETEKALALDPDLTPTYGSRAFNQLFLNRPDDALQTVRVATERNLQSPQLLLIPFFVAFLNGDDDTVRRTVTAAGGDPELKDVISHLEALAFARAGRLDDARQMSALPVEIARRSGLRERAALFEAGRAVWEAFYGNAVAARQSARRALELGRGRDVDYAAAFALALSGDLRQSRLLAEDLGREFPEDTSVQFMYLPTLRALFSLSADDPAKAIQALQIASRYDLALGGTGFIGRFGGLYPVYVRGLAYLAARRPTDAAAEFQRILDHRNIVLVDPVDAMARLQLARTRALAGDTLGAKNAYEDLFALWADADSESPVLKQARAEFALLR